MDIVIASVTLLLAVGINAMHVAYKAGKTSKEIEANKEVLDLKIESVKEVLDLKIKHEEQANQDVKDTLKELQTTIARLAKELNQLLGQLEGES